MWVGGQRHASVALLPGKTRHPLYRRLGGPQGRSGRVRNISPPQGFDPRTVQPVVSRYTDRDIANHLPAPYTSHNFNFLHPCKCVLSKLSQKAHTDRKYSTYRNSCIPSCDRCIRNTVKSNSVNFLGLCSGLVSDSFILGCDAPSLVKLFLAFRIVRAFMVKGVQFRTESFANNYRRKTISKRNGHIIFLSPCSFSSYV